MQGDDDDNDDDDDDDNDDDAGTVTKVFGWLTPIPCVPTTVSLRGRPSYPLWSVVVHAYIFSVPRNAKVKLSLTTASRSMQRVAQPGNGPLATQPCVPLMADKVARR